ncbi:unnamed protein product [Blepharisma stoltei]|uniref:Uncharacterized protein n=1 Tax=Blepharisma stoltei TaxID=1481888 RepID=A0AAU9IV00_9CILI|nr:unnamed protein product [Blepharisma stoltei]
MSGERKEPTPAKRTTQANGKNEPKPAKKAKILEEAGESSDEDFAPNASESSEEEPPLLSDEGEHGEDEDFDLAGYIKFRERHTEEQEGSSEEELEENASEESESEGEGEEEPESSAEESEEYEDSSSEGEKPKKSNGKKTN